MNDNLNPPLASNVWRQLVSKRLVLFTVLAVGGTVALTVSAKIQVPFYPIPMTLQSMVVLLIGAAFGARLAGATLALYLAEGLSGLPVLAGLGAGPSYMVGPTGGYLAGFLVAAGLVGWLVERGWDRSLPRLLGAMTLGHMLIFALGFSWLAVSIGSEKAWLFGVTPFVWSTLVKTVLASALVLIASPRLKFLRDAVR
jgi:biotin transport system substrate-specific component